MNQYNYEVLNKFAAEERTFGFDFSGTAEMINGDLIQSIDSITAAPDDEELTLGSPTISGDDVTALVAISGGTPGTKYLLTCTITTTSGAVLVAQEFLFVVPV